MGKNVMLSSQFSEVLKTANTAPIAVTIIGIALIVIAALVWRRRKEGKLEEIRKMHKNKVVFTQWIAEIVLALKAAYFMFDGDILGENTTGISAVIGTVGICLVATSNVNPLCFKRKRTRLEHQTKATTQNSLIIQSAY